MRIEPRLKYYKEGQRLTLNSINSIIRRIEYGATLASELTLIAGQGITFEGGKIKALKQDEYPKLPPGLRPPINPTRLGCGGSIGWSVSDVVGYDKCPDSGPPCNTGVPTCASLTVSGYVVSSGVWPKECLGTLQPKCAYAFSVDNTGSLGNVSLDQGPCSLPSATGVLTPTQASFDDKYFFLYVKYFAKNSIGGGPYGFTGSGSFFLS
jgi:hypothetical protein